MACHRQGLHYRHPQPDNSYTHWLLHNRHWVAHLKTKRQYYRHQYRSNGSQSHAPYNHHNYKVRPVILSSKATKQLRNTQILCNERLSHNWHLTKCRYEVIQTYALNNQCLSPPYKKDMHHQSQCSLLGKNFGLYRMN